MKTGIVKLAIRFFLIIMLMATFITMLHAWGFWGHKRINRIAVFTLPPQMINLYKSNIEYITDHAVDPDKRRYSNPEEAPRHYIDLDRYGYYPFDSLPRRWNDAVAKYTEDTLKQHGIVVWHVPLMLHRLTEAFKNKDLNRILHYSADIGHYIADAHVPLHCTSNYNGQLTNQTGIHGFWESRIPELFGEDYDYFVGKAEYIEHPSDFMWKVVLTSSSEVDSVLAMERDLTAEFGSDRKYAFEQRGETTVRTYSVDFSAAYQERLHDMQERKMRAAIVAVGSFWYTAWVDAGKPDLGDLKKTPLEESEQLELEAMDKAWRDGKIYGREHSD